MNQQHGGQSLNNIVYLIWFFVVVVAVVAIPCFAEHKNMNEPSRNGGKITSTDANISYGTQQHWMR